MIWTRCTQKIQTCDSRPRATGHEGRPGPGRSRGARGAASEDNGRGRHTCRAGVDAVPHVMDTTFDFQNAFSVAAPGQAKAYYRDVALSR